MKKGLDAFRKANGGSYPARVIIFRDGVSSGQFIAVKAIEILNVKQAMEEVKCSATLTFLTVQKRHHFRLFPIGGESDRSGNVSNN